MKNLIKTLIPISISVIIFIVLNSHFGKIPPLGNFFSPYSGFRQNNSNMDTIPEDMILPGLIEDVEIIWDKRKVPHIFANNTHDLYLAQGYIIARDRLWQMEIQTHNAAGRLSEVLGAQTLNIDRFNRRIGLAYGAENAYSEIQKDPEAGDAVEAFSEGVNAWINTLDESTYPVEYKILGYSPEEWTPYKSALLLKRMCWTLTGVHDEKAMNVTRQLIGEADVNRFFPFYPPNMDPIIPSETNWRFTPLKSPDNPGDNFNPRISMNYGQTEERYFVGSNNWAVSGERTKSGYPILCNDPHLGLTLPSIWYEIQLTAPGLNVYGVTLTGMPGVTIGFNSDIAWGVTNGGSDVLDWYKIKFNANNSEYSYDGDILRTQTRIEEIGIKGADSFLDTVLYTVHGPVVKLRNEEIFGNNIPVDCSMRWTGHDASNDLLTFLKLNSAKNYDDYFDALSHFDTPAQNFVFASIDGDIAITHNGKFPLRWKSQGRYILDGSDPAYDWQGWIPREHLPLIRNPERGFVSSANQFPADPAYPYYLGWYYASYVRGARINDVLGKLQSASPEDMMNLHKDVLDIRAETVLPVLLGMIEIADLTEAESEAFEALSGWNFEFKSDKTAPTIYEELWRQIRGKTWTDDLENENGSYMIPSSDITASYILNEPEGIYFDIKDTPEVESAADIVNLSFKDALVNLNEKYGDFSGSWSWGNTKSTDINHMGNIPGFGSVNLPTDGRSGIVNATGRTFGPSMRMIVSLGKNLRAWIVYPGGQTGNQGSVYYDHMVDDWVEGKYHEVIYLRSPAGSNDKIIGKTILKAGK